MFEKLQPYKHLGEPDKSRTVAVQFFLHWFGDDSLSSIISNNCRNYILFPSFGALSSLKYLRINGFSRIMVIGRKFYGIRSNYSLFGFQL